METAPQSEVLEQVKTLGADLKKQMADIEGKAATKADLTDAVTQFENLKAKYDEALSLAKKAGGDIEALATRVNRELVPDAGREARAKGLREQIEGALISLTEKGFGTEMKDNKSIELKSGQNAISTKAVGDMSNSNLSGYAARDIRSNVVYAPVRPVRIRELISVSPMTAPILEYPQEVGTEGVVGMQTEGSAKSQIDFDLEMKSETPKTMAVFARMTKQSLADIPWLSTYLSRRLADKWLDKEDDQILNGDGTGQNYNGIIPRATDYVKTSGVGSNRYEYLADAIGQLENAHYNVGGILINPIDFVSMVIYKATGSGEFTHPGLIYGPDGILRFYGTPIFKNSAITRLSAVVGDWSQADLCVREALNFAVSYDDSTNFTTNKVTYRLEGRGVLAVYDAAGFRHLNFAEFAS